MTGKKHPEHVCLQARRMHREGMNCRSIAKTLDVAPSTIRRWLDPDYAKRMRELSLNAKRRRTGICEDCGTVTRYNGHTSNSASRFCRPCANVRNGAAKKVWTRDKIIAAIRWWADAYGRQPAIPDFNPTGCDLMGDYRRGERAARHIANKEIPWFTSVVREFGSWNTGIAAAGFTPAANHGGGDNVQRRRNTRTA